MKRKFECWNCHKQFEADDAEWVACPHCKSDNVEYASWHFPLWMKWGTVIVVVVIAAIYAISQIDWKPDHTEPVIDSSDSTAVVKYVADSIYTNETGLKNPPSIVVGELSFEDDGYEFSAEVKNPPQLKYYFVVREAFGEKIIAKSDDGHFSSVPCSEAEGGSYKVQIISQGTDSVWASEDVPGFIKQGKPKHRMTAAELQTKISMRAPSLMGIGESDYLSPDCKLKFTGLSKNATNVPQIIAEVFEKLDNGAWTSAKVSSLEYDDMNRISVVTFKVVEEDLDF